jgi:hypothetical protein
MSAQGYVWSSAEQALYERCRAAARSGDPLEPGDTVALLRLVREVYDRAHSSAVKRLNKASELTRVVRLLRDERVYGAALLSERVEFLLYMMADSPQRPLQEQAALGLLMLEFTHGWSQDEALLSLTRDALVSGPLKTLGAFGLAVRLDVAEAQVLKEGFGKLGMQERRARIAELVGVLDAYGDEPGIAAVVSGTFEALFRGLTQEDKVMLADRLFREIEERRDHKTVPWHLLFDPLVSQNVHNAQLQLRVLQLLDAVEPARGEQYALLHLQHTPPEFIERRAIKFLAQHGTRAAIPVLHALSQLPEQFFLFDRHAGVRGAAKEALAAVIERAKLGGLEFGALTLAETSGGELSLVASQGELSLAGPAPAQGYALAAVEASAPRVSLWSRLMAALRRLFGRG